ncbi:hypothetical protein [Mesorhizobium australafricanum]|uniref:Uncharacterized protein n=1 Tax=Mesorhizobium australafricanum TaxID=3072311 RepID=A0ABU4WV65_9HYPH|nr:hypothetical protein [Mesorhizobium sp. VK3E]MDX8439952.1 hypothetical protein [Mesorhizobium sp. VK3E]
MDAADGVKARRILFSLGKPPGDLLAALHALDRFERAIVECDDPSAIETHRLNCLAVLDRLTASGQPRELLEQFQENYAAVGLGALP